MTLSEFKKQIATCAEISFVLPNGISVAKNFHITEVGQIYKRYIDCDGNIRTEKKICLQLWEAYDFEHRINSLKLLEILNRSEQELGLEDGEIEVEYQQETISKYGLSFSGSHFVLHTLYTDCLAGDKCGIPSEKLKINLASLNSTKSNCIPGSGCC